MKALTIKQPYASLIAYRIKEYETRHWSTSHRGMLAIHAGKSKTEKRMFLYHPIIRLSWQGYPSFDDLPFGAVVAYAELVNVFKTADIRDSVSDWERAMGGWADGRYAWQLANVQRIVFPPPARGQQGLWYFDENYWYSKP